MFAVIGLLLMSLGAGCDVGPSPTQTPIVPSPLPTPQVPPGLIAFTRYDADKREQVWFMDLAGHHQRRLTLAGESMRPAWSPNGRLLAYVYREEGDKEWQAQLYDPRYQTDRPIEAVSDEMLASVEWSPNSRYLVLDTGTSIARELYIIDVSTGHIVDELVAYGYAWSPDSNRLVFGLLMPQVTPIVDIEVNGSLSLAVMEVGRGQPPQVVVTGTAQMLYFPRAWLPDGRVLYVPLQLDREEDEVALWTIALDGERGEPQPAANIPPAYDRDAVLARLPAEMQRPDTGSFSWSTDGRWVVFHAGEGADKSIYLFDWAGGGQPRRLADGAYPSWQPTLVE